MSNTIITKAGSDFLSTSSELGMLVAIKYCIPVYDYRLDKSIHTNLQSMTSAISYESTISDTAYTFHDY